MFSQKVKKWGIVFSLAFGVSRLLHAQVPALQLENTPVGLTGAAGLPLAAPASARVWGGFASLDTLKTITFGGAYGVGAQGVNGFNIGGAISVKRFSVFAWTSGLTVRLTDVMPSVSFLQRNSRFGTQYLFGHTSVVAGAQVTYTSINASARTQAVYPYLSVAHKVGAWQVGARFSNILGTKAQAEGLVGQVRDSSLISRETKAAIDAPRQFLIYGQGLHTFSLLTIGYSVGFSLVQNAAKELLTFGSGTSGAALQTAISLSYKDKIFAQAGYRPAQERKLSQVSYGLLLKGKEVSLQYSSQNLYYFGSHRIHNLGLVFTTR